MGLNPLSPCCGKPLFAKIGTLEIVCSKCDFEFVISKKFDFEESRIQFATKMDKAVDQDEKEYWCGCIGGMRYTLQKEGLK